MMNVNTSKLLIFLVAVVFASPVYAATAYKWVDKEGVVTFTDDYSKIPREYRTHLQTEELPDYPSVEPPAPPSAASNPSPKMEKPETDIYGMGPDYWRDRVRPWEQKLEEAQENILAVDAKVQGKINALSGRFLSHTQYNMNSIELQDLQAERARYVAQEDEAKEMLQKIAKEAQDAKADPSWLKE